ncbi:SHOCT domain-containing protein [Agromyces bauzanensis]|uniref:SHOCT domain-containing protein n=1 Tax=Agromyces bauzanensis TaxID=1308924 RepID=A0A917PUF8_9MICO|nr:SHOCT domain-containing protein [Agromyces bauzanensis]GGJ92806.1 hypothetical protein GCM10011372_34190 [Agromyces bauzanensis]
MPIRTMGRPGLIGMATRTAVIAGTATAVSGDVARRQNARGRQPCGAEQYQAQQAAPAAPAAGGDVVAELQKLAALKEQAILDDAEFAAAKAKRWADPTG